MPNALALRPITIADAMLTSNDAVETIAAWASGTIYVLGDQKRSDTTHRIYESAIGASLGTITVTIAAPGVVTSTAHGLAANTKVAFTTTIALPTGLSANTIYYVRNPAANTFELSATSGGASITTSGTQSGVHTGYSSPNLGYDPTNDAYQPDTWIDIAPTNRWAMFDAVKSTRTEWTGTGTTVLTPGSQVDALGLARVTGDSVTVTVNDGASDVYSSTTNFTSLDGVNNWYDWWFQERMQDDTAFFDDLPAVSDPVITVELFGADPITSPIAIGALQIGRQLDIGSTEIGPNLGFKDYNTYDDDGFGGITVTERGYAYWEEVRLLIPNTRIHYVRDQILAYRGVPIFFRLDDNLAVLIAFGFPKRFDIEIAYHNYSLVSLRVEETLQ